MANTRVLVQSQFSKITESISDKFKRDLSQRIGVTVSGHRSLPNLTDETRIKFHKEITRLHIAHMFDLNSSRLWRVSWSFFNDLIIDQLLRDNLKEHFMTGYISEGGTYFGYLLLNRETRGYEVMHLLGSPYSSSLFELEVNKLHIKPANELSLQV